LNDTPRDKATFDFSVSAPQGLTVMANGVLVSHATSGDRMSLGHFFDVWLYQPKKPVSR
jgi:aminopeptidase N